MKIFSIVVFTTFVTWLVINILAIIGVYFEIGPNYITEEVITKSFIGLGGFIYISMFMFCGASILIMGHTQKDI